MKNLELRLDSNVFIYKMEQDNVIRLHEVYRVAPDMSLVMNPIEVWNPEFGTVSTSISLWERRMDLQGLSLIGAVMDVSLQC